MKKVLEVRNEIGVYNNTLNRFIKTFDLKIFNLTYLKDYRLKELRDYHEIKEELYLLLISNRNEIREYSSDYKKWKSVEEISRKIKVDSSLLLNYFNSNRKTLFSPTITFSDNGKSQRIEYLDLRKLENENISLITEMKQISSYQILKEIQLNYRFEILINNANKTH